MIKLRNEAELARQELHLTRQQLSKLQNNHDLILAQQRAALQEDRQQAESRVAELDAQLAAMHEKYSHAAAIHKKVGCVFGGMGFCRCCCCVRLVCLNTLMNASFIVIYIEYFK